MGEKTMIENEALVITNSFSIETSTSTYDPTTSNQAMMTNTKKCTFCRLTLNEILTILCAAAIPIALGIYTGISYNQQRQEADQTRQFDLQQAAELRQQALYDKFLNDMYNLDKDGHLDDKNSPWAFANAYHRAAQRQWDAIRKADVLQFLKERQLIGKAISINTRSIEQSSNKFRLNELNFDNVYLRSQTGSLNQLDFRYILFDQVSMINGRFSYVNLDETSFNQARLNYGKFDHSSLVNANFDQTELHQTDFGNSKLTGTRFFNVDLSTAKLTEEQLRQAVFSNTILPNGTLIKPLTTTESPIKITASTVGGTLFTMQSTMSSHSAVLTSENTSLLSTNTLDLQTSAMTLNSTTTTTSTSSASTSPTFTEENETSTSALTSP